MESTISGTVGEVAGRTVNTKNGPAPIFDVNIGDTQVSTFKADIAEQAKVLQGSAVEATVSVRQNGQYTNYTLLGVKLIDAAPQNGNTASTTAVAPAAEKKGWQPEDTARVTKLSCLSTAFSYAGVQGISVDTALSIAQRLYGIAMGDHEASVPEAELAGVAREATEKEDGIPW